MMFRAESAPRIWFIVSDFANSKPLSNSTPKAPTSPGWPTQRKRTKKQSTNNILGKWRGISISSSA